MKPYAFLLGAWALTLAAFRPVFDAATATGTNAGVLPLSIRPGTSIGLHGARQLGNAEVAEEDARVSLALIHHYMP